MTAAESRSPDLLFFLFCEKAEIRRKNLLEWARYMI